MKHRLLAGLVFLLIQSAATAAGTHSKTDDIGNAAAVILNQPAGTDWTLRTEQIRELKLEMARDGKIPTLFLTLVNKANVSAKILTAAKTEVEKIYRQAGVRVAWNSYGHGERSNTIQLTVVIVRKCVNKQTCQDPSAAGTALGSDGRGARWAYVFYNRVRESAEKSTLNWPSESLILGLAIAHEAGHLLLPLGHAPSGLMRSEINIATLSETTSDLQFTSDQAVRICNLLRTSVNWVNPDLPRVFLVKIKGGTAVRRSGSQPN